MRELSQSKSSRWRSTSLSPVWFSGLSLQRFPYRPLEGFFRSTSRSVDGKPEIRDNGKRKAVCRMATDGRTTTLLIGSNRHGQVSFYQFRPFRQHHSRRRLLSDEFRPARGQHLRTERSRRILRHEARLSAAEGVRRRRHLRLEILRTGSLPTSHCRRIRRPVSSRPVLEPRPVLPFPSSGGQSLLVSARQGRCSHRHSL